MREPSVASPALEGLSSYVHGQTSNVPYPRSGLGSFQAKASLSESNINEDSAR